MRSFQAYILYVNDTTKGKRMDGVMMAQESAREFALLTDQEISQLRIKTGKGHRTQNDWTFISELLQGCIVILPTWFFFRKAPLYPKHTIPEGFYLQVYLAILSYILYSIFVENISIAFVLTLCYDFMAYKQLFGYGYWGTLWRLATCIVLSFSAMLLLAMICFLISKYLLS